MSISSKVIVFLGAPGSGKGTQAYSLSSALGIPAISTGEMLRHEARCGSALGKAVKNLLEAGRLVNDGLMEQVIAGRISQADCKRGCILDGFPRTVAQARYLDTLLAKLTMPSPVAINLDISCEEVVSRLSCRRQCPQCGRIFGAGNSAYGAEVFCDRDGSILIQRADDQPTTIRERLRVYTKNASELISYYQTRDYHRICANRTPAEISEELASLLALEYPASAMVGSAKAVIQTGYQL